MLRNMTKRSLSIGAGFALVASGLAAMPASADNNGPITLLPDGLTAPNSTFNTIAGAPLTLAATLNPTLNVDGDGDLTAGVDSNTTDRALFIIDNPDAAQLKLDFVSAPGEVGYYLYDSDGLASAVQSATTTETTVAVSGGEAVSTIAPSDKDTKAGTYVDFDGDSGTDGQNFFTNATKIALLAGVNDGTNTDDTIRSLKVDLQAGKDAESSASITVQVLTDTNFTSNSGAGAAQINAFEHTSAKETVNIYPLSEVTATTTISKLQVSAIDAAAGVAGTLDDQSERDEFGFQAKTVIGGNVNPRAVSNFVYVQLRKDGGDPLFLNAEDGQGTGLDNAAQVDEFPFSSASKLESTIYYKTSSDTSTSPSTQTTAQGLRSFENGSYSAQLVWSPAGDGSGLLSLGSPSPVVDLTAGLVTGVDEADAFATEGANLKYTEGSPDAGLIRTGTNAVTVQVEAEDTSNDRIKSSGIEYRVVATANKLASTSTISMSGTTTTLSAKDDTATATAVSGSTGLVDIVVSNSGAVKGDKVTLVIDAKKTDGTYSTADTVTLEWVDADLDTFKASPAYVSGANPTVTFKAADQFGQPVNATDVGQLSVTVVAEVGGVDDTSLVSETKTLVNGEASFTFANFATGAGQARLQADLFEGRDAVADSDLSSGNNTIFVTVYDTDGVDSISVLDSYATDVIYADYVVGDEDDAAVAKAIADTNFTAEASVDITGSVLDANSVGQPGAEVVISGEGLLFYDSQLGIYAEDSITIYANEFGAYDVTVRSHEQNAAGVPVTITSGSVTADTLVKTYFPSSGLGADTLVFSWDLPAELVMNTTYAVTASLKDIWGNPVDTANGTNSVTFDGNGAVQVNGIANATNKDFNADGEVTVFVRSIKDIAGPAEVTATLNQVANQYFVEPLSDGTVQTAQLASLTTRSSDVDTTSWDETLFDSTLEAEFDVKETATPSSTQKVNAGSFKGYVAVYALGYEGQRLSAKIGNDWVIVDPIVNNESANLARVTDFTGAGVDIAVRIYIDRVLIDTINLTTK